jgi:pimeloyl-ACP methyl ester carboxylesterase
MIPAASPARARLELLFLHALPLDGTMWAAQQHLLPGATHVPTLYTLGDSVEAWAESALKLVKGDRIIVVGCSVGGSCALDVAAIAPDRVAALVLIGTKARHRPDPALHAHALQIIRERGLDAAWETFWKPLFSPAADPRVVDEAKRMLLRHPPADIARGTTVFHSRPSRDDLLAAFPRPVHVVTGAEDISPALSKAQAESAPRGRLHVIPDCGHYAPLERPAQLNAILEEVIAGTGNEP